MKIIKTKKSNLETKRMIFFEMGLVIALAVVLLAFEWKSTNKGGFDLNLNRVEIIDEDMAEITIQKKKQPEMPKPALIQKIVAVLDEIEIDDDLVINAEDDANVFNDLDFVIEEEADRENVEQTPFTIVEQMPSFQGGEKAYFNFLKKNLKYPQWAKDANIEGVVYIKFVVTPSGSVANAVIERKLGGGCDEEALRVVKSMPDWIPGRQRSIAVPVQMVIPVHFKLLR